MTKIFSSLHLFISTVYTVVSIAIMGLIGPVELLAIGIARKLNFADFILRNQVFFFFISYACIFGAGFIPLDSLGQILGFSGLNLVGLFLYFSAINDLNALLHKHEGNLTWTERFFARRMHNPRDVFHIEQMVRVTLAIVPLYATLFIPHFVNWFVFIMFFRVRYRAFAVIESLLHQGMHTAYLRTHHLKSGWDRFVFKGTEFYINYILGPIMGYPPHFYFVHHMHNHHRENSGLEDITTLVHYDRTSFFDFCRASFRFFWSWITGYDLFFYLYKRQAYRLMGLLAFGLIYFYAIIATILYLNPFAGGVVILGQLVTGVGVGVQLWYWHAFVNNDDPGNIYQNTVNILFPVYTYDSYHIEHHKHANVHWTKYPANVVKDFPRYIAEGSICFRGYLSREQLLFQLWLKRFDLIATHMINFNKEKRSKKEMAEFLESRTRPLHPVPHSRFYYTAEKWMVWAVLRLSGEDLYAPQVNYMRNYVEAWSEKVEPFFPGTEGMEPFPLTQSYSTPTSS